MPEILLHYIWQRQLFAPYPQYTTDGCRVEVLSIGEHNLNSGPDFSAVRLRIYPPHELFGEPQEWCGNVEIHVHSSDWYKHRHHLDKAYDNIILHVVRRADKKVYNTAGEAIRQLELNYPGDEDYIARMLADATQMDSMLTRLNCSKRLLQSPGLLTDGWRHTLLRQRFDCKLASIDRLLKIKNQSWNEAFYISLARNFGFHTNSTAFEQLAIQTPLACLLKHRRNLFQLTAILYGQSGLLSPDHSPVAGFPRTLTEEEQALWGEYQFLRHKFNLTPLDAHIWKQSRLRPQNAPEVRIRQLAQLIHQSELLFSSLMSTDDLNRMIAILSLKNMEIDEKSQLIPPPFIGSDSINILLINTVLPYRYAWLKHQGRLEELQQVFDMMAAIAAENNTIIRQWRTMGQKVHNAADTQALIHLFQTYCQSEACIQCDVAYQIFLLNP